MNRTQADELLTWAHTQNPGPWLDHSYGVARAAEKIAQACGMDAERAWLSGAIHDIGRYEGVFGLRHATAGYHLLMNRGEPQLARVCLTHSFPLPLRESFMGAQDTTPEDAALLDGVLKTPMDDYDRLIQLCDGLSWGRGVCLMEKRLISVMRRRGVVTRQGDIVNARFAILEDFQARIGHSIYDLFPEAAENTFHGAGVNP